ncbi:hypothetical protein [Meiothermus luteus]|uniref:hypothetical protein n=1 Tax=Meiothermus luteus TaxID=2026184 RepID=UPI0011C43EBB|nr:hypothetical protein [Meiothermus luteus]
MRTLIIYNPEYYQKRLKGIKAEGPKSLLVAWSLREPLCWIVGTNIPLDLARTVQRPPRPLLKDFQETPRELNMAEAKKIALAVLRAEGLEPREEPVVLPGDPELLAAAIAPRLRVCIEGWTVEETARRLVKLKFSDLEPDQPVGVADVGNPIPTVVYLDDPRPMRWEGVSA